jgi:nucleotide-binding universal stress UspA family protein
MFHKKILVAMDTSAISQDVFDEALSLAKALKASLMLLHVISSEEDASLNMLILPSLEYYPVVSDKTREIYREQWQAFEKQGLELLRSRTDEATAAGVNTEFAQNIGSPGRTICDLAKTWGADLIVMGRRGRSGLGELILGSVSNYVLHHAPCSVLAVQYPIKTSTQSAADQSSKVSA